MTADRRRTGTRDALANAALVLFRRQGISGTGVAEVCREAGVSKGVFAHHFPGGKKELVVTALARNDDFLATLLDRLVEQPPMTTQELIRALFSRYATLMRRYGTDVGCPMAAAAVDAGAGAAGAGSATAAAVDRWRGMLVSRYPAVGGHDELVLATLEGALVLARATGDPDVLERIGEALAAFVGSPG